MINQPTSLPHWAEFVQYVQSMGNDLDEFTYSQLEDRYREWLPTTTYIIDAAERIRQDDEAASGCGSPYTMFQSPHNRREDIRLVVYSLLERSQR